MQAWFAHIMELVPASDLTVRAQLTPPDDQGTLVWDQFFPRQNVDSIKVRDVSTLNYRPVADRRAWNARGRRIPLQLPPRREITMVPIESNFKIDEEEMQFLAESAGQDAARIIEVVGARIPQRVDGLAAANYRTLELDAMRAWTTGTLVMRNPELPTQTVVADLDFDATRIAAAVTAWDDPGVDAYDEFVAWVEEGIQAIGGARGVLMRRSTLNAILTDAPNLPNGVLMTRSMLQQRIEDDLGQGFELMVNENTVDLFTTGGFTTTQTNTWPDQTLALIPTGTNVGYTAFAPVIRAGDVSPAQLAGADVRGNTVFYLESNGGRSLDVECQLNCLPIPDEGRVWATDAGV